jgi:hypothetical protein
MEYDCNNSRGGKAVSSEYVLLILFQRTVFAFLPAFPSPTVGPGRYFRENTSATSYPTMFNPPFTLRICPVI